MKLTRLIILLLLFVFFASCRKDNSDVTTSALKYQYSFFVAGHTYGNPISYQYGLHPPFVKNIDYLNKYPKMEFGFLTGDIVPISNLSYWDSARMDINKFDMPIHISRGNHDEGAIFDSLYSHYYSFKRYNDLFIILSPEDWNIEGEQKTFLENTIQENKSLVNNIYIFTHQLIWWSPTNEFSNIKINYLPNYPGSSNYWSEINPILDSLDNNVFMFAGDLGATSVVTPYMYHQADNITFIASGMGNYTLDNVIVVEVDYEGNPTFKLLGINAKRPYEIENLEEFILP